MRDCDYGAILEHVAPQGSLQHCVSLNVYGRLSMNVSDTYLTSELQAYRGFVEYQDICRS